MPVRDQVSRYVDETTPNEEVVERVKDEVLGDAEYARVMLAHLPEVPADAVLRTQARITAEARDRKRSWGWMAAPLGLAAAAALVIGVMSVPSAPVELAQTLAADGEQIEVQPTEHVRLAYDGQGQLGGTDRAPRLQWESGSVHVEVTPDQGIDFRVQTADAEVRVLGTVFDVNSTHLGTQVTVNEGKVAVLCEDGVERVLRAGETGECLPSTAAGLLGRARAFQAQGAHDLSLMAAEKGLAIKGTEPAVVSELSLVRIEELVALGSASEAVSMVERYLQLHPGSNRAPELHRTAAAVLLQRGDCVSAWPHLDALPDRTPDEDGWLAACPPE